MSRRAAFGDRPAGDRAGVREDAGPAGGRARYPCAEHRRAGFPTPLEVIEAAHRAALDGQTGYPPTAGHPCVARGRGPKARADARRGDHLDGGIDGQVGPHHPHFARDVVAVALGEEEKPCLAYGGVLRADIAECVASVTRVSGTRAADGRRRGSRAGRCHTITSACATEVAGEYSQSRAPSSAGAQPVTPPRSPPGRLSHRQRVERSRTAPARWRSIGWCCPQKSNFTPCARGSSAE